MKLLIFIQLFVILYAKKESKTSKPKEQKVPQQLTARFDNPNFIRDRLRKIIVKPEMPPTWTDRHKQAFHPNWMDYCDPYHCNDFHKIACGLNRRTMRFKWFQSTCHLILNNQCSDFRGHLKYDPIATKFCQAYVMFLRGGCPQYDDCDEHKLNPLCAMSSIDGHFVLFQNKCFMDAVNCRNSTLQEYDEVYMSLCEHALFVETDSKDEVPITLNGLRPISNEYKQ